MAVEIDNYFCLLENITTDEDRIDLGDYAVVQMTPDVLAESLYCRPYGSLNSVAQHRVTLYSQWTWGCFDNPVEMPQDPLKSSLRHMLLAWNHVRETCYWPFDPLIKTLNLLHPSDGPVLPIQYYHVTAEARAGRTQVETRILAEPVTSGDEQGNEWPFLQGYAIRAVDSRAYCDLERTVRDALGKDEPQTSSSNAHLWIAEEYFERGNRAMLQILDPVVTLMFYEFALEALYLLERDRGSKAILKRRVPPAVDPSADVPLERLHAFLEQIHVIRSKAAHGARPIRELERLVRNTDVEQLFLPRFAFGGALANLREVARRSILFFVKRHMEGIGREEVLQQLDEAQASAE